MKRLPLCLFAFLFLSLIAAKDAQAGAPRVNGTLTGVVSFTSIEGNGVVPGGIQAGDIVTVTFSYDLDESTYDPVEGVYRFNPAYPDNFLSIFINGLEWTSGDGAESFMILIGDNSLPTFLVDFFQTEPTPPFQSFPGQYTEPGNETVMGLQLVDQTEPFDMITMEGGPGSLFHINGDKVDYGWGPIGSSFGGDTWYIEFEIDPNTVQINEEPDQAGAPRVNGTLTGVVEIVQGAALDCVSFDNAVSVEFSYDLDDIDESISGGGVYGFAQAWPDNFLSISISSACNGLTWTSGESFSIFIEDGLFDLFDVWGEQPVHEFPLKYEPTMMGFELSDMNGEMITMENGPGPVPIFSIHPQHIDDGWGLIGQIGGENWYIEFTINTWQITEEPDYIPTTEEPKSITVPVDIKPQGCKNRINLRRKWGYVWVGILGTGDLDVTQIDPESVMLEGVSPLRWRYRDVTAPVEAATKQADCQQDCTNESRDQKRDLLLKFKRSKLIKALKALGYVDHKGCYTLELTGEMLNGTPIEGYDRVYTLNKKKKKKKNK
jgi:hypothetical protein